MANNGKLKFEIDLPQAKKDEIWTFLNTVVSVREEVRFALTSSKADHYDTCIQYWHTSTDKKEHITITVMHDVFVEAFYHVYRDGTTRLIEEGRAIYYTTEEGDEVGANGQRKKKKVWRVKDGGKPITSASLKADYALIVDIFG